MFQTRDAIQQESRSDSYAALKNRAWQALDRAEFKKAEKLFEWAYVEAERRHDTALQERALCNMAAAAIPAGTGARYLGEIRAILGRSADPETRFLAAYNLAFFFELKGALKKALFYAQIAGRQAAALEDTLPAAAAAYSQGKLWLGESRLQQAQRSIETSIELLDERSERRNHALETSTLGYCLALLGKKRRALALLESSTAAIADLACRLYEPAARLNFGFALLEMDELESAHRQAERALGLPCSPGDRKYALYLSGETASMLGQLDTAQEQFGQLQEEFYPQLPDLACELASNHTHGFISWLA